MAYVQPAFHNLRYDQWGNLIPFDDAGLMPGQQAGGFGPFGMPAGVGVGVNDPGVGVAPGAGAEPPRRAGFPPGRGDPGGPANPNADQPYVAARLPYGVRPNANKPNRNGFVVPNFYDMLNNGIPGGADWDKITGQMWQVNQANQQASLGLQNMNAQLKGQNMANQSAQEIERIRANALLGGENIRATALGKALGLMGNFGVSGDSTTGKPQYTSNIGQGINYQPGPYKLGYGGKGWGGLQ